MIILNDDYCIEIRYINFYSQYRFKTIFQLYYHNKINYCSNALFIDTLKSFDIIDFLSLSNNKITHSVIEKLNKISEVDLYRILDLGYVYLKNDINILFDLFVPFEHIKIIKNNIVLKNTYIYPTIDYFSNIVDQNQFLKEIEEYTYIDYKKRHTKRNINELDMTSIIDNNIPFL
jgi:hypothetical protein